MLVKGGDKLIKDNYRPISILPSVSKLLKEQYTYNLVRILSRTYQYRHVNLDFVLENQQQPEQIISVWKYECIQARTTNVQLNGIISSYIWPVTKKPVSD